MKSVLLLCEENFKLNFKLFNLNYFLKEGTRDLLSLINQKKTELNLCRIFSILTLNKPNAFFANNKKTSLLILGVRGVNLQILEKV